MSLFADLLAYSLEIEWLLSWFPVRAGADLSAPQMRGGTIRLKNTNAAFEAGNREVFFLGQGEGGTNDPLAPENVVSGFIDIGVRSSDRVFEATLQLVVGGASRSKHVTLEPDTVVPFLVNVSAARGANIVHDTAAALQGVVITGHRITVTDVLTRMVGP